MGRTDYFHDPNAPRANSLVVAAVVFVQNDRGAVLLVQRSDSGLWALPGGAMEIGETVADAAVRETREETGYEVRIDGLIGVYSDPAHVIAYSDGEVRQQFALSFRASLTGGEVQGSPEVMNVAWVGAGELDRVQMHPAMRLRVRHGFHEDGAIPFLG